ncbi:MAG: DUF1553 domain-containing protein [Planctomycetes bacterium]|nr:DUF1553 domain-containing protein [Planctomycetota bacterium]
MAGFLQSSAYRQVRFESMEHNARVAQRWEALQDEHRPQVARAAAESRQGVIDNLAAYLSAARDVNRHRTQGGASSTIFLGETAIGRGLNVSLLSRWASHLEKAKDDPRDPLHAWAVAGDEGDFEAKRERLLEQFAAQKRRADESLADVQTIIDYRTAPPEVWIVDGPTFGAGPVTTGSIVLGDSAESPVANVAEYSAARRDPLWNGLKLADGAEGEPGRNGEWVRAGRTVRTPTFTIAAENAYYLVRGAGHVYAVVDSHRVNNGPLHGSLIQSFENVAEPQWMAHPLERYRGHGAHLEFSARGEAPLEVLMVVQGDRPPGDPLDRSNALLAQALADAKSPADLARRYRAMFLQVLEKLRENRIAGSPAAADEARLVNWILDHHELTVENQDSLQHLVQAGEAFRAERQSLAATIMAESHTAPAMWDGSGEDEFLLIRGNPRTPGGRVPRRLLEALAGSEPLECDPGSGRLQLARQIADPANPLTARVMVNRVWHHLFGRGIVASVDNFGLLGEPPTHPELLDYLATTFIDDAWSVKRLIRKIVLSRTYRMSSVPADAAAEQADPTNSLLHRMRIRRLEGEAIRDALLAVSGRLDPTLLGPSVPVHLTPFMQGRGRPAESGPLDGAGRRSIYGEVRRNFLSPMMLAFDAPAPFSTMGRRNVSNVPAQALILMNDPFVVEQARRWAERELAGEETSAEDRVMRLYLTAFARPPHPNETAAAVAFLDHQAEEYGLQPESGAPDVRVWTDLCHALFNSKEFIFVQ